MASNKKAQILAAVMCASSIFGSYTVVSAADTPTKIESTDKSSSVTANNNNQIKLQLEYQVVNNLQLL